MNIMTLYSAAITVALGAVVPASAESKPRIQALDKVTVAVTDFTEAGRELPVPSPKRPVYYIGVNAGLRNYNGVTIAGDRPPDEKGMLRILAEALAEQGFVGADDQHPATQVIVCSWGVIGSTGHNLSGPGPGIHFLGGPKLSFVMEENTIPGHLSPDVLLRGFRSGAAETVLSMSHDTLYGVLIRSYDLSAAQAGKIEQLWETRIACSSRGHYLAQTAPGLVVSGTRVIGRETIEPVVKNVARSRAEWGEIGETIYLEFIDPADLEKARAAARNTPRPAVPAVPPSPTPPAPEAEQSAEEPGISR